MSLATTRTDPRPTAPSKHPTRPAFVGAVLLDAMAAIAGPPVHAEYERAWNAAFDIVAGAASS
jgi:hemoglobin-like flavoprotein